MEDLLEFIVPCHNEQPNIQGFYQAFCEAFGALNWNLIMVDDGSSDATYAEIKRIAEKDSRVRAIRFSRNFGKEAAMYAGLEYSKGAYVGIIDADLQQPPAIAREMFDELRAHDEIDCVAAYQEQRKENFMVGALKGRFYRVFEKTTNAKVIANASDFRVFRRTVADALLSLPESYRFSKGIFSWIGFEVLPYAYTPQERAGGVSKWSVKDLFAYALEGLLSFTTSPLHSITKCGVAISVIAFLYAIFLIIQTFIFGIDVPGYASTVLLILFFGGGQFLAIGILGEYLARTYVQGKHRPIYIVKDSFNTDTPQGVEKTCQTR